MSDEQDKLKLSLEPPKLFGRKKKQAEPSEPAGSQPPARPSKAASAKAAPKKATAKPGAKESTPVAEPAPVELEQAEEPTTVVDGGDTTETDPPPAPHDAADAELTALIEDVAAAESGPEPAPEPEPEPEAEPDAEPNEETTVVPEPEPDVARAEPRAATAVLPAVEQEPTPVVETPPKASPKKTSAKKVTPATKAPPAAKATAEPVEVEPEPVDEAELEDAEIAARLDGDNGPLLTVYRAAAVTGLVVGVALVVLTWLSLRGCEAVRGTSSCGGGPGFLLLIATFAISVLLGSAMLKAFLVPDPGSSSFLAVGLVAVVALLFLIDVLDSWVMLIVIPVLGIAAYLASVWVTKTFVEPAADT